MKTVYEFTEAIEELLDSAMNNLSPEAFNRLLDNISIIMDDYE